MNRVSVQTFRSLSDWEYVWSSSKFETDMDGHVSWPKDKLGFGWASAVWLYKSEVPTKQTPSIFFKAAHLIFAAKRRSKDAIEEKRSVIGFMTVGFYGLELFHPMFDIDPDNQGHHCDTDYY